MIDSNKLNAVVQQVLDAMPAGLKQLPQDIQQNLRLAMQNAFSKMDLVTREEFDAQTGVLQKTRQKLEALERQVAAMEEERQK